MLLTLPATRPTPHGTTRLVQAMSAWLVKTRRAPSRHCSHARVYSHTTTAMWDMNENTPPSKNYLACLFFVFLQTFDWSKLYGRPPTDSFGRIPSCLAPPHPTRHGTARPGMTRRNTTLHMRMARSDDAAAQRQERALVHHVCGTGAVHAGRDADAVTAAKLGSKFCGPGGTIDERDGVQGRGGSRVASESLPERQAGTGLCVVCTWRDEVGCSW